MVLNENDLASLVGSEIRIVLLYCSREEAKTILQIANKLGLTGTYVLNLWLDFLL